jgi:hypothetical protein
VRQEYFAGEGSSQGADRAVLLQVTSIFERVVWMVQRMSRLLEVRPTGQAEGQPA